MEVTLKLPEFMKKRKLSKDGKYYFASDGAKMYVQGVNSKKFKIPKELNKYKKLAIWEIGPTGKTLTLNNVKIQ
jgi:hypothetical protein